MAPDKMESIHLQMNGFIFQNVKRKDLTIETQSFWKSEDLVKKLYAQNLIFERLSQCISLKKNPFI